MHPSYNYKAYGLMVNSELLIPELETAEGTPDVIIKFGKVPMHLENASETGIRFEASQDEFLLKIDNIARYYVWAGREIVIEPLNEGREDDIIVFLLGTVFGALLHQRGFLVLHGSCIEVNGEGVLFTGVSGIGKSTLAAAFYEKGYPVLTDDVSAVFIGEDEAPYIMPGMPSLKLWQDSAVKFGKDTQTLVPLRKEMNKYRLEIGDKFVAGPLPLSRIYILNTDFETEIKINEISSLDRLTTLIDNTYRIRFLKGQGGKALHFKQCAVLANKVGIYRVQRPKSGFRINELLERLEKELV